MSKTFAEKIAREDSYDRGYNAGYYMGKIDGCSYLQNEILIYLFNKECEAESMPYSDVRQERIATLREVIRYVEE